MRVKTAIIGSKEVAKAISKVQSEYEDAYRAHVKTATLVLHNEAVKQIRNKSPGTPQTRYKPKREVVAAKPGEAPNTDTGTAIKNIGWEITEDGFSGVVGSNLKYLKWLEFGTKLMEARPWLGPALEITKKQLKAIFRGGRKKGQKVG
jgi:HK97 gp10 family phage protein